MLRQFQGGWGQKDGPTQNVDTAWQLAAFDIIKFKDGKIDKRCTDSFSPVAQQVTDTDPVNFIVVVPANPAIDIEKYVNGDDADNPPGPTVNVGDTVTFTYVVTNTGNTTLNNIAVIDSTLGPVICPLATLQPGETMNCGPETEVVVTPGPMFMQATVTGTSPSGTPATDTDPVNFIVVAPANPAIDIEKYVNGYDADNPPGPTVNVGDTLHLHLRRHQHRQHHTQQHPVIDSTLGP